MPPGLSGDNRGRIKVNEHFVTEVPHIYAVGDVIGFPALASTSMEQGRLAAYHACDEPVHAMHELQPIGIYTIPEISFVGRTEDELTEQLVPFEVGISRYRELARGQITGDSHGMLKLLVAPGDRTPAGRARVRHRRHRARPHRTGRDGLRRQRRLPRRRGVQLPDAGRVVQGRGAGRDEQDPAYRPAARVRRGSRNTAATAVSP